MEINNYELLQWGWIIAGTVFILLNLIFGVWAIEFFFLGVSAILIGLITAITPLKKIPFTILFQIQILVFAIIAFIQILIIRIKVKRKKDLVDILSDETTVIVTEEITPCRTGRVELRGTIKTNTLILPANFSDISSLIASAMSTVKTVKPDGNTQ